MLATFLVLVLLVVLYLAGPKVSVDTSFVSPDLPEDLDEYLRGVESRFTDITPGAEKTIHWADPQRKHKTPIAFVYFHGFSATRQESMPVPQEIANHYGSNIFYSRLTGNGRGTEAMALGSVNTWVNDAAEALAIAAEIGERTVVIGCSTGASLGWWTSHQDQFKDQIAALVFFSPNFGLADPRGTLLTVRWGRQIAETVLGKYIEGEPASEAHATYWATRYPTRALLPMMGMVKVARKIKPARCNNPVIIFYSPYDDTVDAGRIQKFYQGLCCDKKCVTFDNPDARSQHVVIGDILAPHNNQRATDEVVTFLNNVLEPQHTAISDSQS